MKKIVTCFFALMMCCFITPSFADAKIISLSSFKQIKQLLLAQRHPHQVLLAMDNDDTLTMMPCPSVTHCQYLGGPAWFSWQSKLPENAKNRIWKTFPDLIAINGLIFNMSKMPLDDSAIPDALQTANGLGMHVVVASARGDDMMNVTERQFHEDHILKLIEKNAIKTPSGHISFPGTYLPTPWNKNAVRPILYMHGILYLSGQNKGMMMRQFLQKTEQTQSIRVIIFVDDTMQNVKDVANAYANDATVQVISVHYTKLAKHKAQFLKSKSLQMQANQQWFALSKTMQKNLVGSDF